MIEITKKGFLTIPVSTKRHFMECFGVSTGGPMDFSRCLLANRLAGNPDDACVLEAAFFLPGLRFTDCRAVAVVGGVEALTFLHNGQKQSLPANRTLFTEPGDELLSCPITGGMRAYLAISGGIRLDTVRPKPVADGDRLALAPGKLPATGRLKKVLPPVPTGKAVLRVISGVQSEQFSSKGMETFYEKEYCYTPQSDRMGIRFSGPVISFAEGCDGNILSEGTVMGDIQMPPSGQPILLMADCQTSGGYAKIAHVITADLPVAAQLRPGDRVRFREVSVFEAQARLHRLNRELEECI